MTSTATETGEERPVGQATAKVQEAASTAQDKAGELKEQGRDKLSETLDRRTNDAGGQVRKMAQALRRSGEQMREEGEGGQVAGVAAGAADRFERLGGYLEQTSGDELLRDVEEFARRRPWMVAGIGLVAGVAASRFLKASSESRYGSMQRSSSTGAYPATPSTPSPTGYAEKPISRESYGTSG
jgi:ElaB/YqjD/DUF883 family membrane-anchored ribosome-binding protein